LIDENGGDAIGKHYAVDRGSVAPAMHLSNAVLRGMGHFRG
jgi:hypothetical protein